MTLTEQLLNEVQSKIIPLGAARHPAADKNHPNHAAWKAATCKRVRNTLDKPVKLPKELDISSNAVHKALEKYNGGTFEHYENEPKHVIKTLPDGRKMAGFHATVTHSYTHKDLGMHPDEMENTAETYHVAVHKHPDHGITVQHIRRDPLHEEFELVEHESKSRYGDGGPYGKQISQDTESAYKEFGTILKGKGYAKSKYSGKQSAQEEHRYEHPNGHTVSFGGWHGTGTGNRDYGGIKMNHYVYDNAHKDKNHGMVHEFMPGDEHETQHGNGRTTVTKAGYDAHKVHLAKVKSHLLSIGKPQLPGVRKEEVELHELSNAIVRKALANALAKQKDLLKKGDYTNAVKKGKQAVFVSSKAKLKEESELDETARKVQTPEQQAANIARGAEGTSNFKERMMQAHVLHPAAGYDKIAAKGWISAADKIKHFGKLRDRPSITEDIEQLDELSPETLMSYKKKAAFDVRSANSTINSFSKSESEKNVAAKARHKRFKGWARANKKLRKEEVELDEATSTCRPGFDAAEHREVGKHLARHIESQLKESNAIPILKALVEQKLKG